MGSPIFILVCLIPLRGILAAPNVVRPSFSDDRLPATKSKCEILDDIIRGNYTNGNSGSGIDYDGEIVVRVLTTRAKAEAICTMMYNATQKFCRLLNERESMIQLTQAKNEFKSRFGVTDEICEDLKKNERLPSFAESARYDDAKKIAGLIFCQLRMKIIEEKKPLCSYFASTNEEGSSNSKPLAVRPLSDSFSLSRVRRSEDNKNGTDAAENADSKNLNNSTQNKSTETRNSSDEPPTSDIEEIYNHKRNESLDESAIVIPGDNRVKSETTKLPENDGESVPESSTNESQSQDSVANNDEGDKKNGTVFSGQVESSLTAAARPSIESEINEPAVTTNSPPINNKETTSTDLPISTVMEDKESEEREDWDDDEEEFSTGLRINGLAGPRPDGSQKRFDGDDDDADDNDDTQNHENSPRNDGFQGKTTKNDENLPTNDGLQGTTSTMVPPTNAAGTLLGTYYARHSIIFGLLLAHVNFCMIFNSIL